MSEEKKEPKKPLFSVRMNPGGARTEAFGRQEMLNGARNALRAAARRQCGYCESPETHKCSVSTMVAGTWLHRFRKSDTPCTAQICCTLIVLSDKELLKEIGYHEGQ
ncbi:hypothetical protein LCGC14_0317830 [marine sediment metagenome]|uniref:Uncharacterized protein n=1 Tax=marine sediment metagenome TaxID=412755 RepID=A0A0F9TQB0_9ZZZZ